MARFTQSSNSPGNAQGIWSRLVNPRLLFVVGISGLYVLVFLTLHPLVGGDADKLAVIPALLMGISLNAPFSFLGGLTLCLLTIWMFLVQGDPLDAGVWLGVVTTIGAATFAGWFMGLQKREESRLRELNNKLELRVLNQTNELRKSKERMLYDALHDGLTGLPNKVLLLDRLGRSLERARRRQDYQFAVLFLDLDRFKIVNDSLGHTIGDQLLVAIARRLMDCLRAGDTVARLGGDEFIVLLEDIADIKDVVRITRRFQEALELPYVVSDHEIFTNVSIGINLSSEHYQLPEDILRDAEITMYRAKVAGRARYEIFDCSMHALAMQRMELDTDLRKAIERKELAVHYQPVISLQNGNIAGFEALVRWHHPDKGFVSPVEFIPVAEENGLIVPIDLFVLREACNQAARWQERFPREHPLTVSVNLSGKHFNQPDLIEQVDTILQETGLSHRSLELEITESALMKNTEITIRIFSELISRGIRLHLDDFGTGYSSLSYLLRFPFHSIKIDRSFIHKIDQDNANLEIIQAIVSLAGNLGMQVVAEGVETKGQLNQVKSIACDFGQGYYFCKPMDHHSAEELIQSRFNVWPLVNCDVPAPSM